MQTSENHLDSAPEWEVTSFYKFCDFGSGEALNDVESSLGQIAASTKAIGLIILAEEGLNGTLAFPVGMRSEFETQLTSMSEIGTLEFKHSSSDKQPFRRFKIKRRDEIVTLGRPDINPAKEQPPYESHLSAEEWHELLNEEDIFLVDTRNHYETAVGKFRGAIDPHISAFTEFETFIEQAQVPKEKKILMYCTGGIRCEKAAIALQRKGYKNVFQLEGGILKYLEKFPEGHYEGECFVFDHRVALDNKLQPTQRYSLCPHCGDPATEHIACVVCERSAVVCEECLALSEHKRTCSKNCAHHSAR